MPSSIPQGDSNSSVVKDEESIKQVDEWIKQVDSLLNVGEKTDNLSLEARAGAIGCAGGLVAGTILIGTGVIAVAALPATIIIVGLGTIGCAGGTMLAKPFARKSRLQDKSNEIQIRELDEEAVRNKQIKDAATARLIKTEDDNAANLAFQKRIELIKGAIDNTPENERDASSQALNLIIRAFANRSAIELSTSSDLSAEEQLADLERSLGMNSKDSLPSSKMTPYSDYNVDNTNVQHVGNNS